MVCPQHAPPRYASLHCLRPGAGPVEHHHQTCETDCTCSSPCAFHAQVYAPSRTVVVYANAQWCDSQADRKPHGVLGLGVLDLGPYYEN